MLRVRQDKHGRNSNIGMASLATEEQANLAIKMLNKTNNQVANEYKHTNQTNNLNNIHRRKIKDTRKLLKKSNFRKQRHIYACESKEYLVNSYNESINPFVTNEEWLQISEEEFKYFLEEYGKISTIKTQRN